MATHGPRAQDRDGLARFLGWFGVALGTTQLAAPRALCRLAGAADDGIAPRVMRLMGARELTQGLGILVRPRPTGWLWSRVAGDVVDVGAVAYLARNGRRRTFGVLASLVPIAIADVQEARFLSRKRGAPQSGKRIRNAVTIAKTRQEVEDAWTNAADLRRAVDERGAQVSFEPAPGGRGTELAVEFVSDPPAGELGVVVQKLTGNDLATELADDLRRFKQLVETGEIVRSDSTPGGHLLAEHLKQRAAQPLEERDREGMRA